MKCNQKFTDAFKPVEAGVVGSPTAGIRVLKVEYLTKDNNQDYNCEDLAAVGVIAVQVAVGVCLEDLIDLIGVAFFQKFFFRFGSRSYRVAAPVRVTTTPIWKAG